MAEGLRKEMALSIRGSVLKRDEETFNPNISTGRVELKAKEIEIAGDCINVLPFDIESSKDVKEELRLKYRYLDLRNPKVHDKIILRSEVIKYLRREMEDLGFTEIQTPILANSSPEGARDYLVPSRKHKGMFYALPQAPQQFKQLLMVSGFDRYFQIAPCFRDEDARLDRSPGEFYQLDFEMAFATQEDVFAVAERVLSETFKRFTDKPVTEPPYVRIPYAEAMLKYGSDKPDLRNPLIITDLSDFFSGVDFAPFRGRVVRAIRVPGAASQPKSFFKSMESFALSIGMKGLGYISVQDDMTYKGPIDKFFTDGQKSEVARLASLEPKDVLYFISDEKELVPGYAGKIRTEVASRLDLIAKDRYDFCFITDYPMYEWNEDLGRIDFTHNPFSMPQGEMDALLNKDPEDILAWQYDIVCNGVELSSGAVRNHRPDVMVKAFEIAGYDEETVESKFGALYNAFSYGAPPHAGMAPGVDRIVMLLSEDENIREIIAFPLNSNAQNTMLGAPGEVSELQLREVHIKIRE
jgi:aspartyl-tRNA synthetase